MTSIFDTRVPLSKIHKIEDISSNLKRNIIISHQRLPKDFFPSKNSLKRQFSDHPHRANLFSQNIKRNFSQIENVQLTPKRDSMTARHGRAQKQEDPILGVISASRQMNKVIRKHSLQFKSKDRKLCQINLNCVRRNNNFNGIELPPLLLKKGATITF